ncbi:MAG: PTPA-CTERM sorting domain-containing protein [Kovacikia sp.]
MDFKTLSLNAAVATAVVAGSAMAISPAQAVTLTSGSIFFQPGNLSSSVSNLGGGTLQLSFTGGTPTGLTGLAGVSGTPVFQNLTLTPNGSGGYTTGPVTNFISGLLFGGDPLSVDLGSTSFNGIFSNPSNYLLGSAIFNLQISSAGVPQLSGQGALFASSTPNNSFGVFSGTQAIPTPALLPGLVGLGWAALRKRKTELREFN